MKKFKATLLDEAAVKRAITRISHEIVEKNNGCNNICIIGIKRRGVSLSEIIAENIYKIEGVRVPTAVLDITFYRDDVEVNLTDPILHPCDIPFSVKDKNIVLVDDVLYTGRTARAAMEAVMRFGRAASIQFAVLIDRGHRELPIRGDYVGKNIPTSKNEVISVKIPPYDEICAVEIYEKVN